MSSFKAIETIYKTYDSLLTYFSEDIDPKSKHFKTQLSSYQFLYTTYLLLDVLAMISKLWLFFQKTNIDLAGIDSAVTGVKNDLKDYKRGTLERPTYFDEIDTELTQEQGKYVFKGPCNENVQQYQYLPQD